MGANIRLEAGEIDRLMHDVWQGGSIGTLSEATVTEQIAQRLQLNQAQLTAFINDLWTEYLGQPNQELITFFASLRPRYGTGILSNSFVGAREREQALYGFADLCDLVIYSHEKEKPQLELYMLACERMVVAAAEALFLDNVPACVAGAQAAGMHAILLPMRRLFWRLTTISSMKEHVN